VVKHLKEIGSSTEEFYFELSKANELDVNAQVADDGYIQTFIECLIASMDYNCFYKCMIKEANKLKLLEKVDESKAAEPKNASRLEDDSKHQEGKNSFK
jgi:hypothetical protein